METKTKKAINLYDEGKFYLCLRIIKKFNNGFTKEEKKILEISHEINRGSEKFYRQLGYDVDKVINESKKIVKSFIKKAKSYEIIHRS